MVAVLSKAGAQVPVMPLVEMVGNGVNVAPEHIAATGLKVGVIIGVTITVAVPAPGWIQPLASVTLIRLYEKVPAVPVGTEIVTIVPEAVVVFEPPLILYVNV